MTDLRHFCDVAPDDLHLVGGKGLSLARLARAGLPVPPGFCVCTLVHQRLGQQGLRTDADLWQRLADACASLGPGLVAVRSSATAEDGAATSFAGQQETFLGVEGLDAVGQAIERCWASLTGERALAYRRKQGVGGPSGCLTMAVVVQRLVHAEVAGVLFTRDPLDPTGESMLVEAAWGLGEGVVSGRVHPDRFHLDRSTGAIREQHVGHKPIQITHAGEQPVPPERQRQPCLAPDALAELCQLARQVEELYGEDRDIEWAWSEGRFWLLQARPITAGGAAEREKVRREEMAALAARTELTGTVWARFNLAESLPDPTPMSWAVARRLLAGRGGFGQMYRDLGYEPDPSLDEEGIFDLVCGRPYCNLSREARLHYRQLPFEHSFAALKADPTRALYPIPTMNAARAGWKFWLFLPITLPLLMIRMTRAELTRAEMMRTFPARFRDRIIPDFAREVEAALQEDLRALDDRAILECFETWLSKTADEFARESLKPTALAALVMGKLEQQLARSLTASGPYGQEKARATVRELILGVRPDPDADLPAALEGLLTGQLDRDTFLARFGHRGDHEMELARPRWAEDPDDLLPRGHHLTGITHRPAADIEATWQRVATEAKLGSRATSLRADLDILRTMLALRETAKHHLLRGYAVLRRLLLELDRRKGLNGRIFYLTPEELPRLLAGEDLSALAVERLKRRTLALSLEMPAVVFSDDLEAIGRPVSVASGDTLRGVPLSAGVAEAPALVLEAVPAGEIPPGPYILVCPSTDPAWVPLFLHAVGLVLETGGVLSHGAIVAREFGLPAVAGLPGLLERVQTGQIVRVDGAAGMVSLR